ncbi:MAG: methylase involved in ubiquinone/menaquinone biosynthesis [uncultured archaeon A07HR60]|nr:MAG: methylase involved in ubiquinone/menaquinone biosynthesis [uncultured archaeon A07HR60]
MGFHTFDPGEADRLNDPTVRYRYLSEEELLSLVDPSPDATVADLGSGTGFYTESVAVSAGDVYAVDVQSQMHDRYHQRGMQSNVTPVTAGIGDLPLQDDELDGAFAVNTYHEFAGDGAMHEVSRVLRPGGRMVIVDWSSRGLGEMGPPTDQRYDLAAACEHLGDAGLQIRRARERRETFVVVAHS